MATQRRRLWIFAVIGVLVLAVLAWVILHKKPTKPAAPQAVSVTAVKAVSQDVQTSLTALGAAQAWTSDTILAQVSGKLTRVNFVEGTDVKAGQLLAEVDSAPYRAALLQAEGALKRDQALLADARLDLVRYQHLLKLDSIARQTVDTQAATVKEDEGTVLIDEGQVAAAKVNLSYCRITAPVSGRVGVRLVDPGNLVSASGSVSSTPSTAAATSATTSSSTSSSGSSSSTSSGSGASGTGIVIVNQIMPIAVTFTIPQGDFQHLSELTNAFRKPLAVQALSQETGKSLGTGQLSIADNRVDPTTGTVELKARFDNPHEQLWPGQFVNVELVLQTLHNVVTIPAGAESHGPNGTFAFVVGADGKAVVRPITVAWTQGSTVVVKSGVQPGDVVVVDGQMVLKAGSLVRVVQPAAGQPGAAAGRAAS